VTGPLCGFAQLEMNVVAPPLVVKAADALAGGDVCVPMVTVPWTVAVPTELLQSVVVTAPSSERSEIVWRPFWPKVPKFVDRRIDVPLGTTVPF
jgi:hypothetical protein